jgi:hypothetical protein
MDIPRHYEQHSGKLFCYILVSYAVGMYFKLTVQNWSYKLHV